jgi:Spy/CpxP family protein refolding chaperone
MKLFFTAQLLFVTACSFSQDSTSGQKSIERIAAVQHQQVVQRITDLNTAQRQQLQSVFDAFANELAALKNKKGREKFRSFKKLHSQKDKKVLQILTAGQQKLYEALMKEWKEKMQQRRKRKK